VVQRSSRDCIGASASDFAAAPHVAKINASQPDQWVLVAKDIAEIQRQIGAYGGSTGLDV
jgi:hypothetical protein